MNTTVRRLAILYARLALGAAFLSAVASRLGLWGAQSSGWAGFLRYTAEVNAFMPSRAIPVLAVLATIAESSLGLALVLGIKPRWTALCAAALLAVFGTAMAISFGLKSPLDYSVYSASAGALLLALLADAPAVSRSAASGVLETNPSNMPAEVA